MKTLHTLLLVIIMAISTVGCIKIGGDPIDKRFYTLSPKRTAISVEPQSDIVLQVRRLSVSDLYDTRELVYQLKNGRIESDFYNLFFVPPGSNLTTELRKWLEASGRFANIIEPGSMAIPTLILEGVVNSLYGDYSTAQPAAVIEMQFFLVDEATAENEIVFSHNYRQRIPLSKADPQGLIQAMTLAVQNIFTQLENDLANAPYK